jgi:hypothetical protein
VGEPAFANGNYSEAAALLDQLTRDDDFIDFLTLVAYDAID